MAHIVDVTAQGIGRNVASDSDHEEILARRPVRFVTANIGI